MKMFPTREELIDEPEFHEWVEEITDQLHDANCIRLKRVPSNPQTYSRLSKELKKSNWKLEGECVYSLVPIKIKIPYGMILNAIFYIGVLVLLCVVNKGDIFLSSVQTLSFFAIKSIADSK